MEVRKNRDNNQRIFEKQSFSGKHYFGDIKMAIFFVEVITWLIHGVCRRIPLTARRHYLAYRESGAVASLYITSSP